MTRRDSALAVLVMVIWGVNFVAIDVGLEDVPPLLFVAIRFCVVLLPAFLWVAKPDIPWRYLAAVGLLMSAGQFGLLYAGLDAGMPIGLASLVLQIQVMLTVIIAAVALREPPTPRQIVGVAVGMAGLVIVGVGRDAATPALALLLTLGAATSWACGNVVSRKVGTTAGLEITVWSAFFVPLPLFLLSLVLDGPDAVGHALAHFSLGAVLSTLYTAILSSLVGYGIFNTLLSKYETANVVPFVLLVPPIGIVSAWLYENEVPNGAEIVGGLVLLAGVAITTLGPRRSVGTT
ncbi:MAG: EamA family transporter [Baekduia sp.]